jgi:hypothetical protein
MLIVHPKNNTVEIVSYLCALFTQACRQGNYSHRNHHLSHRNWFPDVSFVSRVFIHINKNKHIVVLCPTV